MTIGLSPKLIAAVITSVITYLLGQTVLELPPAAVVVGQAILIGVAAYAANPGVVLDVEEDEFGLSADVDEPSAPVE